MTISMMLGAKRWLVISTAAVTSVVACGSANAPSGQEPPGADAAGADDGGVVEMEAGVDAAGAADARVSPARDASSSGPGDDAGGGTSRDAATAPDANVVIDANSAGPCKRGMATNQAPSTAFVPSASSPGISWFYDWSNKTPSGGAPVAFVPMIWGASTDNGPIPTASFVLGYNEPNFKAQSNLTAAQAAADWPNVEALAKAQGIPIVSPAVNFCGSASNTTGCSDPSVTDPYTYLKDFFADCAGCEVDYVAVHWYNCDLPSLRAYIDGSSSLQGFVQFGKPIWVTELACDSTHSAADQKAYMQAAVPYLEQNPNVYRYAWFSASNIPNALLQNSDGTLTDLGATYVSLPQSCQ